MANSKLRSLISAQPTRFNQYAFVIVRLVIAAFWLNSDVPRWLVLAVGHPQANGLVRNLFGPEMVVPLTYFFTLLETLGAIALILGLAVKLTSIWAIVEFAITGTTGVLGGTGGLIKDFGLLACALVLLLNGSSALSLDALISKKASN